MGLFEQHYLENKDEIDARVNSRLAEKENSTRSSVSGYVPVGAFNQYTDPARQPKMSRQHAAEDQRWKDDYNAQVRAYDRQQKAYQTYQDRMGMDVEQGKKELALRDNEMVNMQMMRRVLEYGAQRNTAMQKHLDAVKQEHEDMQASTADLRTRLGEAEAYQADAENAEEYAHRRTTTRDAETVKKELEAAKKAAEQARAGGFYIDNDSEFVSRGVSRQHEEYFRRMAGDSQATKKLADRRLQELEEEYRWARHFEYVDLAKKPDFGVLSAYNNSISDPLYRAINGDENAKAELVSRHLGSPDGGMALTNLYMATTEGDQEAAYMGKDEIAIYNYIYATEGAQAAADYYEFIKTESFNAPSLNTKRRADIEEQMREYAKDKPFWSSVGTVLASPAKVMTAAGQLADYVSNGELENDAAYNMFSYAPTAVRSQVASDILENANGSAWGEIGSAAYGLGMSAADFLFNTAVSGGSAKLAGALMATEVFADTIISSKDRGLSDDQAIGLASVAAVAELFTEKFSIEALLDGAWEKNALQYILKNGLTEGTEEGASSLINFFADILVARDKSQWKQALAEYESRGMNEQDAFMAAFMDQARSIGFDVFGGFVTGGVMSGGRAAAGTIHQGIANRNAGNILDDPAFREEMERQSKIADDFLNWRPEEQQGANEQGEELSYLLDGLVPDAKQNKQLNIDNAANTPYNKENGGAGNGSTGQLYGTSGTGVRAGLDSDRIDRGISVGPETNGQGDLSLPGVVLLSPKSQQILKQRGIVNIELHESSNDNAVFSFALQQARNADLQNGWAVTPKDAVKLDESGTRTFLSSNGNTGFAIAPDGDIQAVFANKTLGAPKGTTKSIIPQAIANGGTKLDCYGVGLVKLYARYGFIPVARTKFNPEYANPGWTSDKGMPDIYFMMHNGDSADTVVENMGNYKSWSMDELNALPEMEYDDGYAYRDSLLAQPVNGNNSQNNQENDLSFLLDNESERFEPNASDDQKAETAVGAKRNQFRNEVVDSKGNTLPFRDAADNVPAVSRAGTTHTVIHEDESLYNAKLRLQQDYAGEKAALEQNPAWGHEEVDMAMQIRADLLEEAERTQNWDEFNRWQRIVKDRNSNAGRNLQAWAKYSRHDGQSIIAAASETLENASKKTDKNAVMTEVSALADRFDKAIKQKQIGASIDALVEVIKLTARSRNTGFYQNKVMGAIPNKLKPLEWAINRVAEIARNADSSVLDKNSLPSNLRFDVGDRIKATDRNNYGNIVANNGDGTYEVHFDNKTTGKNATVTMNADQLRAVGTQKAGDAASSTGASLSTQAFEQQKANEAYQFLKDMAENGVLNIANDTVPATLGEQVMTARRWSLLSKVATFVRNIGGNTLSDVLGAIATNQAVGVDRLLSKKTGTRSVAANHISKAGVSGSLDGAAMGILSVALDVDASNGGKYGAGLRTNKMSGGIFSKIASVLEGVQGLALVVPDYAAKGGIEVEYNRGIGRLYDKGLVADDSLAEAGKREAEYRTYTNETALTSAISTIRRTADKANLGVVTKLLPEHMQDGAQNLGLDQVGLGTMAAPFAQVPANVGTMTVDYATGLRGLFQIGKVLSDAKHGNLTADQQAKVAKTIGKGMTAIELATAATILALGGVIKFVDNPADDDENADEKAFRRGRGESGVQWNADAFNRMMSGKPSTEWQNGDNLMSLAWAENLNAYLGFGALLAEDIQNERVTLGGIANDFANATASTLMDMPLADTFADAIETARYTSGGVWDKSVAAAQNFAVNTAGGFIPNFAKGVAQGLDPYQRDLYTADTALGQLGDQFKAAFDRDGLPIKYDSFGRPMMNEPGWSGFANANFRPGYRTTYRTDSMQDELERLAASTGTASVYPSRKAPNEVTTKDGVVKLTEDQKEQYKKSYGATEDAIRTALTESEAYERLPENGKLKANQIAENYAKQAASNGLDIGYEAESWVNELQNESPEEIIAEIFNKTIVSLAESKGEELGGKKYDGLAWLYDEGIIDESEARSQMSDTMREVYDTTNANGKKFEVSDMIDVYAAAARADSNNKEAQFDAALAYIDQQVKDGAWDNTKATELAGAMGQVLKIYIPKEQEPAAAWLKKYGAAGQQMIYNNMSDTQKEQYDWIKRAHGNLNITPYMFETAVTYKGGLKKKDGYSVQNQFRDYLNTVYGSNTMVKRVIWDAIYESRSPWG